MFAWTSTHTFWMWICCAVSLCWQDSFVLALLGCLAWMCKGKHHCRKNVQDVLAFKTNCTLPSALMFSPYRPRSLHTVRSKQEFGQKTQQLGSGHLQIQNQIQKCSINGNVTYISWSFPVYIQSNKVTISNAKVPNPRHSGACHCTCVRVLTRNRSVSWLSHACHAHCFVPAHAKFAHEFLTLFHRPCATYL